MCLIASFATACTTHSSARDKRLTQPVHKVPPSENYTLRTATQTIKDNYDVIDLCNDKLKALDSE